MQADPKHSLERHHAKKSCPKHLSPINLGLHRHWVRRNLYHLTERVLKTTELDPSKTLVAIDSYKRTVQNAHSGMWFFLTLFLVFFSSTTTTVATAEDSFEAQNFPVCERWKEQHEKCHIIFYQQMISPRSIGFVQSGSIFYYFRERIGEARLLREKNNYPSCFRAEC